MSHPYSENQAPASQRTSNPVANLLNYLPIAITLIVGFTLWRDYQSHTTSETAMATIQAENALKANVRDNITSYVQASASTFQAVLMGGISGLSVTVTNTSQYMMDNVVVEVSYVKADGDIYKKEYLNFPYLEANHRMTIHAPDSPRGIRVTYQITSIKSRALNL